MVSKRELFETITLFNLQSVPKEQRVKLKSQNKPK